MKNVNWVVVREWRFKYCKNSIKKWKKQQSKSIHSFCEIKCQQMDYDPGKLLSRLLTSEKERFTISFNEMKRKVTMTKQKQVEERRKIN